MFIILVPIAVVSLTSGYNLDVVTIIFQSMER
jgi:hypothetical protein